MSARGQFVTPLRIVLLTAVAAILPLATSAVAAAGSPGDTQSHRASPQIAQCYTNVSQPTGAGVNSQNFEAGFENLDDAGATAVTLDKRCTVGKVIVHGFYLSGWGQGPANSENVTFFTSAGGLPGTVLKNGYQTNLGGTETNGTFSILLNRKVKLKPGTYWVSVAVNMSQETGGLWEWNVDEYDAKYEAAWENPGGGWNIGCLMWETISQCGLSSSGRSLQTELWRAHNS